MIMEISKYISIENSIDFSSPTSKLQFNNNTIDYSKFTHKNMFMLNDRIRVKDKWYETLSVKRAFHSKNSDGYYHLIYIQINFKTNEYYIGKVNRERWSEVKRYQGSGLKFENKYKNHEKEFKRYYLATCSTSKECEELEAEIVDKNLLTDEKCLNLVAGGGGTNEHYDTEKRSARQKEIMAEHPEFFQGMVNTAKILFQSGPTPALESRNAKIKETMNQDKYKDMSRNRIHQWKENNPEDYAEARKKNKIAINSAECKKKKAESRERFKQNHADEYKANIEKALKAAHSPEAEEKRRNSLKQFAANNPEKAQNNAKKRADAAAEKLSKPVLMKDKSSGEVIRRFNSVQEAARWLFEQGKTKSKNSASTISATCLKKLTPGHGVRKSAYGFGWSFESEHEQS